HALGAHLAARGDLPAVDVPPPEATDYDGALVAGVRRFQTRHGLAPDGVLGARTVAAARVPAAARVRQIVMALERLRWLPGLGARRLVAVNIPMFRLWAWDALGPAAAPVFSTPVIVGKAMRTETPVFVETMDHVIFRPYWNVPASILRDEVLPAIRRNPGYLAREQMEIVDGQSDDALPVPLGPDALEALAAGTLRVRQRPGPHNSLGLVKFMFPNREGVYLHGTPAPRLFEHARRDFSHGCIRIADPPGLAQWALQGAAGWDAARIEAAMTGEGSRRVDLAAPIDVVLFYLTAAVWPEDGTVHFADDIYGHDAALERALANRPSSR
ncbi:MAG TPA: L,D-transpeptidase family protein, partial [Vicinamibacterales bacterium]|nr:L,D-transpeptidase family protein [Vicinamibacterales bacterium]